MGLSPGSRVVESQGWEVNVKRVERLWRAHQLKVPPRRQKASGQRALGDDAHALWSLPPTGPGSIWSYDFMSVRTSKGTKLRILNVIAEYTGVCVGFHVGYSIGSETVKTQMARLFAEHGAPAMIRSDNGREFIATGCWSGYALRGSSRSMSRRPARSRTGSSSGSTARCAMSCSSASRSTP